MQCIENGEGFRNKSLYNEDMMTITMKSHDTTNVIKRSSSFFTRRVFINISLLPPLVLKIKYTYINIYIRLYTYVYVYLFQKYFFISYFFHIFIFASYFRVFYISLYFISFNAPIFILIFCIVDTLINQFKRFYETLVTHNAQFIHAGI